MKHTITVCLGSSCFARGNKKNLKLIQDYIARNDMIRDCSLAGRVCANSCSQGPVIIIDGEQFGHVDSETLIDILDSKLKEEASK